MWHLGINVDFPMKKTVIEQLLFFKICSCSVSQFQQPAFNSHFDCHRLVTFFSDREKWSRDTYTYSTLFCSDFKWWTLSTEHWTLNKIRRNRNIRNCKKRRSKQGEMHSSHIRPLCLRLLRYESLGDFHLFVQLLSLCEPGVFLPDMIAELTT